MAALIAVDAMGGDDAPGPEVAGAVAAVREHGADILLLGDEPRIQRELARCEARSLNIPIRHCREVIGMRDAPAQAVRQKRDASMRVAFEMLRKGQVQAVVSAGHSGAMMACGLLVLGRVHGVDRPGIVVTFPALDPHAPEEGLSPCTLLDMGANVECRPINLAQFAVLGATFAHKRHGKARPRVGLLSNGEEESKGTELLRQSHALLSRPVERDFDYVGFVEGRDIFEFHRPAGAGRAGAAIPLGGLDVVVTDGFTGNVVLKTAEGAARLLTELFRRTARRSWLSRLGALCMLPSLRKTQSLIDVERRGGALLLGVRGVVVLCHGRTTARAVCSAVELAREQVRAGLAPALEAAVRRHRPLWTEPQAQEDKEP